MTVTGEVVGVEDGNLGTSAASAPGFRAQEKVAQLHRRRLLLTAAVTET